jgi:hypothetical protein
LDDRVDIRGDILASAYDPLGNGDIVGAHDVFEDGFIHSNRGAYHTGAYVGDVRHLEEALQRAVFTEGAMQDGEDHVQFSDRRDDFLPIY